MRFFKDTRRRGGVGFAVLMLGILVTACSPGNPPMSASNAGQGALSSGAAMEAVHASYLDLSGNIADLRVRVDEWTQGNESSLNIAKEKLDRIDAVLGSTHWPSVMLAAIGKVRAGHAPMSNALNAKDLAAATTAAKTLGDAAHDVTHAFYGDWLPSLKEQHFSPMAPHAIYLDLSANLADLRSRVAAWGQGDENSLNIAKEKVDRIQVLIQHASTTGTLLKPLKAILSSLPSISGALEHKDAAAANQALKPLSDAAHDLTHEFYTWMGVTSGADDPACVQAAYLDLSLNTADLKSRITAWEQGDASSADIAQEKLDRIQGVLAHTAWPQAMAASILQINAAVPAVAHALNMKSPSESQQAVKPISDASHEVTHAYYGDWLPHAQMVASASHSGMQHGSTGPALVLTDMSQHSASHSHSDTAMATPDPNKPILLGGFGFVNALVIVTAAILKWRQPKKTRAQRTLENADPGSGGSE